MSAYPIYQVDYYKNFREMLFGIAQKYAQKPAITWYPRTGCAQTKSYRDLEMDAFLFAEALCAHGCGKAYRHCCREQLRVGLRIFRHCGMWFGRYLH